MNLLASTADLLLYTSDPWAANSTVPTRFYAVTAVKTDGTESFLSEWVSNDDRGHDGLSDEEETAFGSDMTKPDTDGDDLNDGEEYLHGTSPVLKNTDEDRFSDYVEVAKGTDPLDIKSKPVAKMSSALFLLLQ